MPDLTETTPRLTRLRTEHSRVSGLLGSLEGERPANKLRISCLTKILAALESAIWFEVAR